MFWRKNTSLFWNYPKSFMCIILFNPYNEVSIIIINPHFKDENIYS
jgi:hypothetical protein